MKLLFVEDNQADVELAVRELKKGGLACISRRVETAVELTRELDAFDPDIVLGDFTLPAFDGLSALQVVRERRPDTPFIFVSGTIGEETAIETLKRGAADYVLKSNLKRLVPAVRRALKEVDEYAARKQADEKQADLNARLQKSREQLTGILATIPGVVWEQYGQPNAATHSTNFVNEYITTLTGFSVEEWLTTRDFWLEIMHPGDREEAARTAVENFRGGKGGSQQFRWITKDGRTLWVESTYGVIHDDKHTPVGFRGVTVDITERKQAEETLRDALQKLDLHARQTPLAYVNWNLKGEVTEWNPSAEKIFGYSRAEALGRHLSFIVPQAVRPYVDQVWAELLTRKGGERSTNENTTRDGEAILCEWYNTPLLDVHGNVIAVTSLAQDITERVRQETRVARLSRIHAVLSGINSAIVRIRDRQELLQDACRIIVEHGGFSIGWIAALDHASGRLVPVAQAGLPRDSATGGDSSGDEAGLVPASTAEVALREKRPAVENDIGREAGVMNGETGPDTLGVRRMAIRMGAKSVIVLPLIVEDKTFGVFTLYAPERNFFDDEEIKLLQGLADDISFALDYIEKENKLSYLAFYDALTGLPNRSLFGERLSQNLYTRAESPEMVAVALMDLERFHMINDTLGRQAGDELLRLIGRRLESNAKVTRCSNPSRVAADGFGVIVRGVRDVGEIAHLIETGMKACFGAPFVVNGQELRVVARAGISVYPVDGTTAEALLQSAEAALKKSKQTKERFAFYAPEMTTQVAKALALETKLRKAIEFDQFVLHYQPKLDFASGKVTGVEALIRWNDPEAGLIPPAHFIPILEETGMIFEVGRWALGRAVKDQQRWRRKGLPTPRVAVNVSALQLRHQDFVLDVKRALESEAGLTPALDLEITESLLMEDIERNIKRLGTLSDIGVGIAIDDFGTGYSSLNYLARLRADALKIDRSFVEGMTESVENRTIVATIISLAHSLGLRVIAEGVETEAQLNLLRTLKCDEGQGYLFGRPVPIDELEATMVGGGQVVTFTDSTPGGDA